MPEKALVTVRFGPYMNGSGVVQHGVSRLQGLREIMVYENYRQGQISFLKIKVGVYFEKAVLVSDGHKVVLEEILDRDTVELMVNGEIVFQCNIKELDFGGDGKLDPLCEEARHAVLKAY